MAKAELTFGEALSSPAVSLYGKTVSGFSAPEEKGLLEKLATGPGKPTIISVHAIRYGLGRCQILPRPSFMLVFGEGKKFEQTECGLSPDEYLKWGLPWDAQVLALDPLMGPVDQVMEQLATRGVSGGMNLSNPRYENGKFCVDVRIWAKIEVLGARVEFDERRTVCIGLNEPCLTVWEIGWANLQVCYKPRNQICLKLCVGKFGIEKCWDACVTIPINEAVAAGQDCGCE